ncbi:MAG: hypothetical protein WAV28_18275 [Sedimentisphaerales bacterium]|jgi:DNA-directed RNA polymerase subunit RPC12/RpoP
MLIITCAKCVNVIDESANIPEKNRKPCPQCGSRARLYDVKITDRIAAHDGLRMKARHGPAGKAFVEAKVGEEVYRKEGKWVDRAMRVDRDNNRYTETVIDRETREIIHHCDEPLSKHRGHDTAKGKKDKDV